ncbi:hypothetical protein BDA96_04G153900 [Sorghum bicolor]|uniref:Uncharacterized protein n=2 Tax=Sorghum bicolor TaxID=4558 RepID=A0A921R4U3_SORBI|nr:hypothetical protein BDA96_04G153900 [Sorghum bicolor]OQU84925.1 hypothetical protein SORBI_3004G144050 [Sorghum bicolor]
MENPKKQYLNTSKRRFLEQDSGWEGKTSIKSYMINARYWWSQQDKTNKNHWLSWEKLTRS